MAFHRSFLFGMLALFTPQTTLAQFPDEEIFSRTTVGNWTLEAAHYVNADTTPPRIGWIGCSALNEDMALRRMRDGTMELNFRARSGPGHSVLNITAVRIGSRLLNARAMSTRFSDKFIDVDYPPDEGIQLSSFVGYLGIETEAGVWMPANVLLDDMLGGASVSVRYRVGEPERQVWKAIDTAGLADAIRWCDAAIQSDAARQFHHASAND